MIYQLQNSSIKTYCERKCFYSFLSYFSKNRSNVCTAMELGGSELDLSCSPHLIQSIVIHSTLSDDSG